MRGGHETRSSSVTRKVDARLIENTRISFRAHSRRAVHASSRRPRALRLVAAAVFVSGPHHPGVGGLTSSLVFGGFHHGGHHPGRGAVPRPVRCTRRTACRPRPIRLLGGLAQRLYLPPGVRLAGVRMAGVRHAGLPVRREISVFRVRSPRPGSDSIRRKKFSIIRRKPGASALTMVRGAPERLAGEGIQVCCVTGLGKGGDEVRELRSKLGSAGQSRSSCPSAIRGHAALAPTWFVSRAGRAHRRIIRCATPAILVPFPPAADNHQWANARFFETQGGGIVLDQQLPRRTRSRSARRDLQRLAPRKFRANLPADDRATCGPHPRRSRGAGVPRLARPAKGASPPSVAPPGSEPHERLATSHDSSDRDVRALHLVGVGERVWPRWPFTCGRRIRGDGRG